MDVRLAPEWRFWSRRKFDARIHDGHLRGWSYIGLLVDGQHRCVIADSPIDAMRRIRWQEKRLRHWHGARHLAYAHHGYHKRMEDQHGIVRDNVRLW